MSARFDQSIPVPRQPGGGLPDLRWPLGLTLAAAIALLLPIPGAPPLLAGFVGLVVVVALFARSWLIALLPVLAVLSYHFLAFQAAGVNVYGFRLVIMILALFSTPLTSGGGWWFNPLARNAILFLVFWLLWGLLSLFWSSDVGGGMGDAITIVFAIGLLLTLLNLDAQRSRHLDKLRFGWLLALVTAAACAFLEITLGRELPSDPSGEVASAAAVSLSGDTVIGSIGALFDNSNMFGGFLLLTVPFVLWAVERARGPAKLMLLGLLGVVPVLILYSASRLALFGLTAEVLFYALVLYRRWYVLLLVALAGLGALSYGSLMVEDLRIAKKLEHVEAGGDRSMAHRVALTLNGLWMVYDTAGRGIGAAAFEEEIAGDVPVELPIRYLSHWTAHNFWVEVISEYGVLVFAAFMALLGWIWRLGWRAQRSPGPDPRDVARAQLGRAILVGLVGYLFFGVAGGSVIPQPVHWMYLASLVVMAASLVDPRERRAAAGPGRPAPEPRPRDVAQPARASS